MLLRHRLLHQQLLLLLFQLLDLLQLLLLLFQLLQRLRPLLLLRGCQPLMCKPHEMHWQENEQAYQQHLLPHQLLQHLEFLKQISMH
jgi:hypothetical protein